jgi:endonuclease/exonuclease/phosphatase (EEP) superfamily protein YafD
VSETQTSPATPTASETAPKKRRRRRHWSGTVLGLAVALGGLVAGRLGYLYPLFDLFSQLGLQFMAMAVAFSIAIFMGRYRSVVGVGLTLALLALYAAWPHIVSTPLQAPPYQLQAGEKLLRLVHFNTYKNNDDYDAIAAEVLRLDGDVVTLVETRPAKIAELKKRLAARYPHWAGCDDTLWCNLVIASKHPITAQEARGQWEGPPYAAATLGGEFAGLHVLAVHTIRFPHSRAQFRQYRELVLLLERFPGDVVMAGDFNATPFSRLLGLIETGAGLSLLTDMPTWPTHMHMPQLAIDHVFASKNFRVVGNQQIGNAAGSDHYPIIITLAHKPVP